MKAHGNAVENARLGLLPGHFFGLFTRAAGIAGLMVIALLADTNAQAQTPTTPLASGVNPAAIQADAVFENFRFHDGETIDRAKIHYATLGQPHRDAAGQIDNAVLVLHWTGSDSRVLLTPSYMKALFDPGGPLDARRYYLIFADNFGHGRSSKPSDGLKTKFPHYGYLDIVELQHRMITETLGIKRLHAILGMSMGGMNAWQWAEMYPDAVEGIMPVVSLPVRVSGRNLVWRRLAISYVESDPDWKDGNYTAPPRGWIHAYQLLRMMIDGVPHLQAIAPDQKQAEKFLAEAARQAAGADPNDVLYSLNASRDYDPESELKAIKAKVFALNFDDDEFNPDSLQILETRTPRVPQGRFVVQPGTPDTFGHLTMAHPELWAHQVAAFMRWLETSS
jgi:homoserine O-acetyltransferase/O-succinyltransferase